GPRGAGADRGLRAGRRRPPHGAGDDQPQAAPARRHALPRRLWVDDRLRRRDHRVLHLHGRLVRRRAHRHDDLQRDRCDGLPADGRLRHGEGVPRGRARGLHQLRDGGARLHHAHAAAGGDGLVPHRRRAGDLRGGIRPDGRGEVALDHPRNRQRAGRRAALHDAPGRRPRDRSRCARVRAGTHPLLLPRGADGARDGCRAHGGRVPLDVGRGRGRPHRHLGPGDRGRADRRPPRHPVPRPARRAARGHGHRPAGPAPAVLEAPTVNDLVFNPLLPWVALIPLTVLLVTGCVVLAVRTSERRIPWLVRAAAVVVLALAFTRPGTPVTAVTERSEAALDVFVVIDVTASMIAEDWNGSSPRLEGVAEDVTALVEQAPEARYSLITFAASSQTVLPLTTDDSALRSALDVLRP